MTKKVFVQTFGCQMNVADSSEMLDALALRGAQETADIDDADVILVNTCTVREHAEHKAVSYLGRLEKWKAARSGRVIIFAGCAAQRLGEKLKKSYQFLDIVAGAKGIENFGGVLDESGLFGTERGGDIIKKSAVTDFVTVMRGCDFKCSYCIVPSVRGPVKCLPPQEILARVKTLAERGVKEIVLLGQTVNAYKYETTDFADLLEAAAAVPGVLRVRFMSPHPLYMTPKLIEVIKNNPKIAKHVHLPAQSGSDKILKDMKRGYDGKMLLDTINALKAAGILVSTDIIIGYPGETEEDFNDTLKLVDAARFSFAYCFKFSPRAGTCAALKNAVSDKDVVKRLDILLNKVKGYAAAAYDRAVGTKQEVLVETPYKGRASGNLWVKFPAKQASGNIVTVLIKKSDGTLLYSE
ncbi:MAG: tRNA (N6-isopentenyl adenosine(37)-C2)-methylthiotransferase MiaB [Elusimicrobium sp.]|jgi:tRNA-2-methylthio-N6-dimethylallyladenosine synthase|nr:tRNA (N6-isopentenyl adenosine(37)-C2)-methylthiotransferase MiaB [Elusimicrobium sp.]